MKKKTCIRNWEVGDCFICKMRCKVYTEYNDKYLILIVGSHYKYSDRKSLYPNVYLKLSDKKIEIFEDIDNAEFIIIDEYHWCERFLPYSGKISTKKLIEERSKVKLYPDEYGFLKEYQLNIYSSKKDKEFIEQCDYMRYEDFKRPEDEFFHWQDEYEDNFQGDILTVPWFFDSLIDNKYRFYNLRESVFYHLPLEDMQAAKDSLAPIYDKYFEFMHEYSKKLDERDTIATNKCLEGIDWKY